MCGYTEREVSRWPAVKRMYAEFRDMGRGDGLGRIHVSRGCPWWLEATCRYLGPKADEIDRREGNEGNTSVLLQFVTNAVGSLVW